MIVIDIQEAGLEDGYMPPWESDGGPVLKRDPKLRVKCIVKECITRLEPYNEGPYCHLHRDLATKVIREELWANHEMAMFFYELLHPGGFRSVIYREYLGAGRDAANRMWRGERPLTPEEEQVFAHRLSESLRDVRDEKSRIDWLVYHVHHTFMAEGSKYTVPTFERNMRVYRNTGVMSPRFKRELRLLWLDLLPPGYDGN